MKIYDKKLSNLRDLRKERQLLKNRLDPKEKESSTDTKASEEEKESFLSGLLSGVTSGSLITSALNVAPTVIDLVKRRSSRKHRMQQAFEAPRPKKNFVTAAITDVVSSYVKWKLLELSYKGIRKALQSDAGRKVRHTTASKFQKLFKK